MYYTAKQKIKHEQEMRNQIMVLDAITMINWTESVGLTEYMDGDGRVICPYLVDMLEDFYWPRYPIHYDRDKYGALALKHGEFDRALDQQKALIDKIIREKNLTPEDIENWRKDEPDFKISGSLRVRTKYPRMDYEVNLDTNQLQNDLYRLVITAVPLNTNPAVSLLRALRGQAPLNQIVNRVAISKHHCWTQRLVIELAIHRLFIDKLGWPESLSVYMI